MTLAKIGRHARRRLRPRSEGPRGRNVLHQRPRLRRRRARQGECSHCAVPSRAVHARSRAVTGLLTGPEVTLRTAARAELCRGRAPDGSSDPHGTLIAFGVGAPCSSPGRSSARGSRAKRARRGLTWPRPCRARLDACAGRRALHLARRLVGSNARTRVERDARLRPTGRRLRRGRTDRASRRGLSNRARASGWQRSPPGRANVRIAGTVMSSTRRFVDPRDQHAGRHSEPARACGIRRGTSAAGPAGDTAQTSDRAAAGLESFTGEASAGEASSTKTTVGIRSRSRRERSRRLHAQTDPGA
ncbi:MAG: hypothetical protein K0S65_1995, partial [Labilithrix sp.]|nr:hypothetical protein [Labilithrix sp.]